jgi:hypothetical protein
MLAAAVLGLIAATTDRARADMVVGFSYSGRGVPGFDGVFADGTGTFSVADGVENIGLSDLKSFSFIFDESANNTITNTVTFGLADLASFSAFIDPTMAVTVLDMTTDAVQGSDPTTLKRVFGASSFNPGGASTYYDLLGFSLQMTAGSVSVTSVVPEPSAFALAVVGTAIVAGGQWRRRRRGVAPEED